MGKVVPVKSKLIYGRNGSGNRTDDDDFLLFPFAFFVFSRTPKVKLKSLFFHLAPFYKIKE